MHLEKGQACANYSTCTPMIISEAYHSQNKDQHTLYSMMKKKGIHVSETWHVVCCAHLMGDVFFLGIIWVPGVISYLSLTLLLLSHL